MNLKNLARKLSAYSCKLSKKLSAVSCKLKAIRGFTLVEMLVVISIIGILYLIVFGSVSDSKARGRDSKRIADIGVIQLALERYYDEYKKYPTLLSDINDSSVPTTDPQGDAYSYTCTTTACQSYELNATLELDNNILKDDAIPDNSPQYDVVPKF